MGFVNGAKLAVLRATEASGVNRRVLNSMWRRRRLVIICWHKIAVEDEHFWNPGLCLSRTSFISRLELLRALDCTVLPLGLALEMVRHDELPPRSVALTFDDGDSSFFLQAWPSLVEYGFPATLYWTSYYSTRPYSVFDPMVSYLLWKGRSKRLALTEPTIRCDLTNVQSRNRAFNVIYQFSEASNWPAAVKEAFVEELARRLEIDYQEIKRRRILHLISTDEAEAMVRQGLDLQLHTHRHRVPRNAAGFAKELADNARFICHVGGAAPVHFCYPSGSVAPEFALWLQEFGIRSATTCQPGVVRRTTSAYLLPRFVDQENIDSVQFSAWLSGLASLMSRQQPMDEHGFR